ncbi:MAG: type II secretion system protein GspD [Terriglobales bacterium]
MAIDPSNLEARQGLASAYSSAPAPPASSEMRVQRAAPPVEIKPTAGRHDFHFRGDLRQGIAVIASAYGMKAYVADALPNAVIRVELSRANFAQAMAALHDLGGVDWIPLDAHALYFAAAGQLLEAAPVGLRTYYLPWIHDGIELNQIANAVRSLLAIREVTTDPSTMAISIRATTGQLDAAEKLFLDLHRSSGQVVLEIKILEINASTARDLGLGIPSEFTMFALGSLLAELRQSGNLQQEILQLFQQGGLNAILNSGQLSAGQLAQAQAALSPLLQNPFVVFGGGATLMALSLPRFSAAASANEVSATSLETALMRAGEGQPAELKIGQRFPVINATFSPISLSPAIGNVIANGSFTQPFPSFTYEDLGLDAKITPWVSPDRELRLQVELTVQALTGMSNNNIPILSNRHLISEVSLKDNEPVVLAGLFNRQEVASLSGLPGLAQIPGFAQVFSTENVQTSEDQLLLTVTPHVVALPAAAATATWLPAGFAPMTGEGAELPPGRAPLGLIPTTAGGRGGG